MASVPCRGRAQPLPGALHPAPSAPSFGRHLSGVRRLRLGRREEQARRLAPCGAWAGESWSRAFAAARSRARQFLQDQQQHFQREEPDDAASQAQTASGSADQHSSRGSGRLTAQPVTGGQLPEGDGGREHALAGAQQHEAAATQLSPEDAEWEEWKAVRDRVGASGLLLPIVPPGLPAEDNRHALLSGLEVWAHAAWALTTSPPPASSVVPPRSQGPHIMS